MVLVDAAADERRIADPALDKTDVAVALGNISLNLTGISDHNIKTYARILLVIRR